MHATRLVSMLITSFDGTDAYAMFEGGGGGSVGEILGNTAEKPEEKDKLIFHLRGPWTNYRKTAKCST